MRKTGLPALVLLVVFLGILGFAGIGVYTFKKDVADMKTASREDISWTATQLELELGQFRESLLKFQIPASGVGVDEVNTRFDILWSRIALFQQGLVGQRLATYDKGSHVVSRLFDLMKSVDRDIVNLKEDDGASAAILLNAFDSFQDELATFSRDVTLGEELRDKATRESLEQSVNLTFALFALATIVAIIVAVYINNESLKFKRLAKANRTLAEAAENASRAKSQFLTMMSHELRTPMNGVLGLLALAKQSETQSHQRNLINQAEKSAQQMIGLLADILDFSALQSDDIKLEAKPFEISYLAKSIVERFGPHARREGVDISVEFDRTCPTRVRADFRRIRQAFGHLTQYIVETAGTRQTRMEFHCEDGFLSMCLSFEYAAEGGEWQPDLILGEESRNGEKFATDAIGPAIARGLIDKMDGTVRVDNPEGNRISVVASIPVAVFDVSMLNVKVLAENEAMAAICRAAIKRDNISFVNEDDDSEVHMVLIESGGYSESRYLQQETEAHPNALLVALGRPNNADAFDFVIELPLDFQELRQIVYRQIA